MNRSKTRIIYEEHRQVGGFRFEMIVWEVPVTIGYPHGVWFRLWFGWYRQTLVLYDVHHGKPYHKHIGGQEFSYEFRNLKTLINDFLSDTERFL